MVQNYLNAIAPEKTPQSEFVFGREKDQVKNNAGGAVFQVTPFQQLRRFLILGSASPTYYVSERNLTKENAQVVLDCMKKDGRAVVAEIVNISKSGRAPKNDPAIFALALCAKLGDDATRSAALDAVNDVCRIGTHLFAFAEAVNSLGGWGRGTKRAIASWYASKTPKDVAYQVTKYQQRNGWSHRDLFRLAHPKELPGGAYGSIYHYIVKGVWRPQHTLAAPSLSARNGDLVYGDYMDDVIAVQTATPEKAALLILSSNLPREVLPTELLKDVRVWDALLHKMPMEAMLRNLATMTRVGLIAPNSAGSKRVVEHLENTEKLLKSRVHPITILKALMQYSAGHGLKGAHTWTPDARVVDALDRAFYASFGNVQSTGLRYGLFLDVSGSMGMGEVAGVPGLTPRVASAAMALVTANTEKQFVTKGFTSGGWNRGNMTGLTDIPLSSRNTIRNVCDAVSGLPFGGTDCALPMLWATSENVPIDVFVTMTDNETWAGAIHPYVALQKYRQKTGINAKLIVVGMVSNKFSIADPRDPGMLDVVGFDTAAPNIMAEFAQGNI